MNLYCYAELHLYCYYDRYKKHAKDFLSTIAMSGTEFSIWIARAYGQILICEKVTGALH